MCRRCHQAYDTWYGADDASAEPAVPARRRRTPGSARARQTLTDAALVLSSQDRQLILNGDLIAELRLRWPDRYMERTASSIGRDLGPSLVVADGKTTVRVRRAADIVAAAEAARHEPI